jgi:hypothetical protein
VTRRQRNDLALLLITRRAERDAWVRDQSPVAAPDALTASSSPSTPTSAGPADGRHYTPGPRGKQAPPRPRRGATERREEVRLDEGSRRSSDTAPGRPPDRRP